MKKIDKFLFGETVRDCDARFLVYLPPALRSRLDDLFMLHEGMEAIDAYTMTNKGLKEVEEAFGRLAQYFKDNPVIELPPLGKS